MRPRWLTLAVALLHLAPLAAGDGKKDEKPAADKPLHVFRGTLDAKDPPDPLLKKSPHKVHEVKFEAGKAYQIDLESQDFDAFLRVEDAGGKHLAYDDGGGAKNARLVFTPKEGGTYRLLATAHLKGQPSGAYIFTVRLADERAQQEQRARELNAAGLMHYQRREYKAAEAVWRQALDIRKKVLSADHPDLATSLHNLGSLLRAQGQREEARRHYEEGLAIRKKVLTAEHPHLALSHNDLGSLLHELGRREEARHHLEQALAISKKGLPANHPQLATSFYNLGTLLSDLGQLREASRYLEQAVAIFRKVLPADHLQLAVSLNSLGQLLNALGKREEACTYLEGSLAILKKVLPADHPDLLISMNNVGVLFHDLGRRDKARRYLEEVLAIRKKVLPGDHPHLATSLNNLARLLGDLGQFEEARRNCEQALAIRKKILPPGHPDLALTLNSLGLLAHHQGRHEEARQYYDEALANYRKALPKDDPRLAKTLSNLGGLLSYLGLHEDARSCQEEALTIHKRHLPPDHPDLAQSLNNLCTPLQGMGQLEEARQHYEQVLAILRKALPKGHPQLALSQVNLGNVLRGLGRYEEARSYLEGALAITKKALPADHPELATSLESLGLLLQDLGRREEARGRIEDALTIRKKAQSADHPDLARTLSNLGLLLSDLGQRAEGRRYMEQALAIFKKALPADHPQLATASINLGALLWKTGHREEGWPLLSGAVATSSRYLRRVASATAQRDHPALVRTGRSLLDLLLSAAAANDALSGGQRQELLLRVVQAKGISAAALGGRRDVLLHGADANARTTADELAPLQRRLANLLLRGPGLLTPEDYRKECNTLRERVDTLERDLSRSVQAFALLNAPPPTPGQLAERLPAGAVFVETVHYRPANLTAKVGEEFWMPARYAALLLRGGGEGPAVRVIDMGEAAPLERAIAGWRAAVQAGKSDAKAERALHSLLWMPLAKALPEKTARLVIAPDGALALMPFEAIRLDDGKYLIERFAVQYVSTGRDLMPLPLPKERSDVALLLADPDYNRAEGDPATKVTDGANKLRAGLEFKRLPGFAKEADAVARLLKGRAGWRVEQGSGAEASEEKLAGVKRPRLLHLVTHGFFLEDVKREPPKGLRDLEMSGGPRLPSFGADPRLRSGLALAGANKWQERSAKGLSDGLLTALEVEGLDLWGTEFVVLSACDTGRGEIQVGEGVLGLRRAFQLAGAQTVLASLWKVPDAETEQLMTDTLSRWLKETPPAEALREAQLGMIRRLRASPDPARREAPPLYWAAFICHGR